MTGEPLEREPDWFRRWLWRGAGWGFWTWPVPDADKPRDQWRWAWQHWPADKPTPIPERTGGLDVFWSVNLLASLPEKGRGGEAHVARVGALYADFDGLLNVDEMFDRCPLPPTAVICSGGGLHAYWLFNEPLVDLRAAKVLQKAWPLIVGSDPVATGLHRPMRVPGTFNAKRAELRPVYWVEGRELRTWSLREVTAAARPVLDQWAEQQPGLKEKAAQAANETVTAAGLAATLRFAANAGQGNRNAALFWAARKWHKAGLTAAEAERLGSEAARHNGLAEAEVLRTVRSAYARKA